MTPGVDRGGCGGKTGVTEASMLCKGSLGTDLRGTLGRGKEGNKVSVVLKESLGGELSGLCGGKR